MRTNRPVFIIYSRNELFKPYNLGLCSVKKTWYNRHSK